MKKVSFLAIVCMVASLATESEVIRAKGKNSKVLECVQKLKECRSDDSKKDSECSRSHMECMNDFDFDHTLPAEIKPIYDSPIMATFKKCFGKLLVCNTDAQGKAEAVETCANQAMTCIRQGKSEEDLLGSLPPTLKKVVRSYATCRKNFGPVKCIQQHIAKVKKLQSKLKEVDSDMEDFDDGTLIDESIPDGGVPGSPDLKLLASTFRKCFNKLVHCNNQDFSNATTCLSDFKECMPSPTTHVSLIPATFKQFKGAAVVPCISDFMTKRGTVDDSTRLSSFISCVISKKIRGLPQAMERHGFCYRSMMQRPHSTDDDATKCLDLYFDCLGPM